MKLVFDVRTDALPALLRIVVICGLALSAIRYLYHQVPFGSGPVFRGTVLGLLAFGFSGYLAVLLLGYALKVVTLNSGTCQVIEGRIRDFESYRGRKIENFELNGQRFEYSRYNIGLEFDDGYLARPLHEGQHIRISASGQSILRLEVEE